MRSGSRVLVLGAEGQLGRELQRRFSGIGEILTCGRELVDLADHEQVRRFVRNIAPDIILNLIDEERLLGFVRYIGRDIILIGAGYREVDGPKSKKDLAMAVKAGAPGV